MSIIRLNKQTKREEKWHLKEDRRKYKQILSQRSSQYRTVKNDRESGRINKIFNIKKNLHTNINVESSC